MYIFKDAMFVKQKDTMQMRLKAGPKMIGSATKQCCDALNKYNLTFYFFLCEANTTGKRNESDNGKYSNCPNK